MVCLIGHLVALYNHTSFWRGTIKFEEKKRRRGRNKRKKELGRSREGKGKAGGGEIHKYFLIHH